MEATQNIKSKLNAEEIQKLGEKHIIPALKGMQEDLKSKNISAGYAQSLATLIFMHIGCHNAAGYFLELCSETTKGGEEKCIIK